MNEPSGDLPRAPGPRPPEARVVEDVARLRRSGFTATEASLLAARLLGLPSLLGGPWTWRELQRLAFLRWLVDTGRFEP
ncbi:MAG TPA: hypothetical protein VGK17_17610 [Propionicimonas sp.]|jgi:hypothetical protein